MDNLFTKTEEDELDNLLSSYSNSSSSISEPQSFSSITPRSYLDILEEVKNTSGKFNYQNLLEYTDSILLNVDDPSEAFAALVKAHEFADHDSTDVRDTFANLGKNFKIAYNVDLENDIEKLLPDFSIRDNNDPNLEVRLTNVDLWKDKAHGDLALMLGPAYDIHKKSIDKIIDDRTKSLRNFHKAGDKYGVVLNADTGEIEFGKGSDLLARFYESMIASPLEGLDPLLGTGGMAEWVQDKIVTNPNNDDDLSAGVATALGQVGGSLLAGGLVALGGKWALGRAGVAAATAATASTRAGTALAAALPASTELQSVYDEALDRTNDNYEAIKATVLATPGVTVDYIVDYLVSRAIIKPFYKWMSKAEKSEEIAKALTTQSPTLSDISSAKKALLKFKDELSESINPNILLAAGLGAAGNAISEPLTSINSAAAVGYIDPNSDPLTEIDKRPLGMEALIGGITGGIIPAGGGVITRFAKGRERELLQQVEAGIRRLEKDESVELARVRDELTAKGEAYWAKKFAEMSPPDETDTIYKLEQKLLADLELDATVKQTKSDFIDVGDGLAPRQEALQTLANRIAETNELIERTNSVRELESVLQELRPLTIRDNLSTEEQVRREELRNNLRNIQKRNLFKKDTVEKDTVTDPKTGSPRQINLARPIGDLSLGDMLNEIDYINRRLVDLEGMNETTVPLAKRREALIDIIRGKLHDPVSAINTSNDVTTLTKDEITAEYNALNTANRIGIISPEHSAYLSKLAEYVKDLNKVPDVDLSKSVQSLSQDILLKEQEQLDSIYIEDRPEYLDTRRDQVYKELLAREEQAKFDEEFNKEVQKEKDVEGNISKKDVAKLSPEETLDEITNLESSPIELTKKQKDRLEELKIKRVYEDKLPYPTKLYKEGDLIEGAGDDVYRDVNTLTGKEVADSLDVLSKIKNKPIELDSYINELTERQAEFDTKVSKIYPDLSTSQKQLVTGYDTLASVKEKLAEEKNPANKKLLQQIIDKLTKKEPTKSVDNATKKETTKNEGSSAQKDTPTPKKKPTKKLPPLPESTDTLVDDGVEKILGDKPAKKSYKLNPEKLDPIEKDTYLSNTDLNKVVNSLRKRLSRGELPSVDKAEKYVASVVDVINLRNKSVSDKVIKKLTKEEKALLEKSKIRLGAPYTFVERLKKVGKDKVLVDSILSKIEEFGAPLEAPIIGVDKNLNYEFLRAKDQYSSDPIKRRKALPERVKLSRTSRAPLITHPRKAIDVVVELNSEVSKKAEALRKQYPKIVREPNPKATKKDVPFTLSIRDIIKELNKLGNANFMWFKLSKDGSIYGKYNGPLKQVLLNVPNDLDTAGHEIAHRFSHKHGIVDEWVDTDRFDSELEQFWIHGTITDNPVIQRAEGVAEYFRAYFHNPAKVKSLAPKYTAYIQDKLPAEDLLQLDKVSNLYSQFIDQFVADPMQVQGNHISRLETMWANTTGWFSNALGSSGEASTLNIITRLMDYFDRKAVMQFFQNTLVEKGAFSKEHLQYNSLDDPKFWTSNISRWGNLFIGMMTNGLHDYYTLVETPNSIYPYGPKMFYEGGIGTLFDRAPDVNMSVSDYAHKVDTIGTALRVESKGLPILERAINLELDPESSTALVKLEGLQNELDSLRKERKSYKDSWQEVPSSIINSIADIKNTIRDIKSSPTDPTTIALKEGLMDKLHSLSGATGKIPTINDLQLAQNALAQFRQMPEDYQEAIMDGVNKHRAYADAILNLAVSFGLRSQEWVDTVKANNNEYYAMGRVIDDDLYAETTAIGTDITKQYKGSTREILPGSLVLLENAAKVLKAGYINKVKETSMNMIDIDVVGDNIISSQIMIERASTGLPPLSKEELAEAVKKTKGSSIFGKTVEGLSDLGFKLSKKPEPGESKNVITVFKKGVPEYWKLPNTDFYNAVTSYKEDYSPLRVPILAQGVALFKKSVTGVIPFAASQFTSDLVDRAMTSGDTIGSVMGTAKAIKDTLKLKGTPQTDLLKLYHGDQRGSQYTNDGNHSASLLQVLREEGLAYSGPVDSKQVKTYFWNKAKDSFFKYNMIYNPKFTTAIEVLGRRGGFETAYKDALSKGVDHLQALAYAAYTAQDQADFANSTKLVRSIDANFGVFFSAGIAMLTSHKRAFSKNPLRYTINAAVLATLIATTERALAIIGGYEDELDQSPNYLKGLYSTIKLDDDAWLRIKLGHQLGFFTSFIHRLMMDDKNGTIDPMEGLFNNFLNSFIPLDITGGGPLAAFMQLEFNKNLFKDRPIVPHHEEDFDLRDRSTPVNSSLFAQTLHKTFIDLGIDDLSAIRKYGDARKIDALIQAIGGTAATQIMNYTDIINADRRAKFLKKTSGMLIGSFAANTPDYDYIVNFMKRVGPVGYKHPEFQRMQSLQQDYYKATSSSEADKAALEFQKATAAFRQTLQTLGSDVLFSDKSLATRAKKEEERRLEREEMPSLMDIFR